MRALDKLPAGTKPGYTDRICIQCKYNSGRRATVRLTKNHYDIIHLSIDSDPERPYQNIVDGYLHIDTEHYDAPLILDTDYNRQERADEIEAINQININHFAGKLTVMSDSEEIAEIWIDAPHRSPKKWVADILSSQKNVCFSDLLNLGDDKPRWYFSFKSLWRALKRQKIQQKIVRPLSKAHLGGSWQNYSASDWLDNARAKSDKPIYLA